MYNADRFFSASGSRTEQSCFGQCNVISACHYHVHGRGLLTVTRKEKLERALSTRTRPFEGKGEKNIKRTNCGMILLREIPYDDTGRYKIYNLVMTQAPLNGPASPVILQHWVVSLAFSCREDQNTRHTMWRARLNDFVTHLCQQTLRRWNRAIARGVFRKLPMVFWQERALIRTLGGAVFFPRIGSGKCYFLL